MQQLHTPEQAAQWLRSRVTGALCTDSRAVRAGDGFVAWPGAAVDARRFVAGALQAGARACLVEADGAGAWDWGDSEAVAGYTGLKADLGPLAESYFHHPSHQLQVLAVTGTNGKTSSAWWLSQALTLLGAAGPGRCGLVGTLGVGFAPLPGSDPTDSPLEPTGLTTPDPVLLRAALRQMHMQGAKACAIEASSIGIVERRLDGLQIHTALFTNFTQDHLDYHGSMDAYWQAKRALFDWPGLQVAVINLDDAQGPTLQDALQGRVPQVWTVSVRGPARLCARALGFGAQGMQFEVVEGSQALPLSTALIGSYNVSNLLGVIATLRGLGVPLRDAVAVCQQLGPVPGRMECIAEPGAPLAVVDYAHTPDALEQALAALRALTQARGGALWCVFGCGGDRDRSKRPLMGATAQQLADRVVLTSDNPRSEAPEAILQQIAEGLSEARPPALQEPDRARAIALALAQAAPEDVVLIAGKGHEATQEVAGVKTPFSDQQQARTALRRRASVASGVAA